MIALRRMDVHRDAPAAALAAVSLGAKRYGRDAYLLEALVGLGKTGVSERTAMKALVKTGPREEDLELKIDWPEASPDPDQVKLRVAAAGRCGTTSTSCAERGDATTPS